MVHEKKRKKKEREKKIFLFGVFEYKKGKKKMRKLWGGILVILLI